LVNTRTVKLFDEFKDSERGVEVERTVIKKVAGRGAGASGEQSVDRRLGKKIEIQRKEKRSVAGKRASAFTWWGRYQAPAGNGGETSNGETHHKGVGKKKKNRDLTNNQKGEGETKKR